MSLILSIFVGVAFGGSVYLMLQKSRIDTLIGFVIFSNAVNLAILAGSGWFAGRKPPILDGETRKVVEGAREITLSAVEPARYVDPIPQALILTAIVIGFALISFLIVLVSRLSEENETAHEETDKGESPT